MMRTAKEALGRRDHLTALNVIPPTTKQKKVRGA